jgi:hypothetical protein
LRYDGVPWPSIVLLLCLELMPHSRAKDCSLLSYRGCTKRISSVILCLLDHLIAELVRGILEFWYQDSSYIVLSQIDRGIHVLQLLWPSISLKTFTNLIGHTLGCKFVGHQGFSLTRIVQGRGNTLNCWVDILIKGCTSMNKMIFEILTDTYGPQKELQDPN